MELLFLGTSASEGFPALFCKCESCEKARRVGGKCIRTRSSVIIDSDIKVDFPPDSYLHMIREGAKIMTFNHLLITHSHQDHFYPQDLSLRRPVFAHDFSGTLNIYSNETVIETCDDYLSEYGPLFSLFKLEKFKSFVVGKALVTPLPADHKPDEDSFLYFIEKNNKTCLYGHDTGVFPQETMDWLETKSIDVAILDCTNGLIDEDTNHMNIPAIIKIKKDFETKGVFHHDSIVVATHFSHNTGLMHDDLERLLNPHDIIVAYDGMKINC